MKKEKLIEKMKEKNEKQVDKYVNSIKELVKSDPYYYYEKEYAKKYFSKT